MITNYKVRPVVIRDAEVLQMVNDHIADLTNGKSGDFDELLTETRAIMATRIFRHHLKYDILCLQEADYLNPSMFPEQYDTAFSTSDHSVNGIAWNNERFDLIETIGSVKDRAFVVELLDKTTGKTVLVASAHLTGSNPFKVEANDADKGNQELTAVAELFDQHPADIKIIAMDSNVTATHPRLEILKEHRYQLDADNFLDPTCSNPHQVLDTRIDWIALRTEGETAATVTNIPVLGVGLNSIQTNMSDHKPIASKIAY